MSKALLVMTEGLGSIDEGGDVARKGRPWEITSMSEWDLRRAMEQSDDARVVIEMMGLEFGE